MKEIKYGDSKDILFIEYAMELLEYFINELLKCEEWEMMGGIKFYNELVTNKISKVKADILSAESEMEKYNTAHERLETLLEKSKEQIKEILDVKKILALLHKE